MHKSDKFKRKMPYVLGLSCLCYIQVDTTSLISESEKMGLIAGNCVKLAFNLNLLYLAKFCNVTVVEKASETIVYLMTVVFVSCDGRVVKALDLKSNGVSPRRFESCSQRSFFGKYFFKIVSLFL